jgi:hypothetical protein
VGGGVCVARCDDGEADRLLCPPHAVTTTEAMNPTLRGGACFGFGGDGNGSLPPLRKRRQATSTILPGLGAASGASRGAGLSSDQQHHHHHQQQQKPQDGDVVHVTRESNKQQAAAEEEQEVPASDAGLACPGLCFGCCSDDPIDRESSLKSLALSRTAVQPSRLRLRPAVTPAEDRHSSSEGPTALLGKNAAIWASVRRVSSTRALLVDTTTDSTAGLDVTAVAKRHGTAPVRGSLPSMRRRSP